MAASDSKPVPIKNAAYRLYFPAYLINGSRNSGGTGMDTEISGDGAAFADATNEAVEIGTSGVYYLDLTASEMNYDAVVIKTAYTNTNAVDAITIINPQEVDDIRVAVTHWQATAVATPDAAGYPKTTLKTGTGAGELAVTSGRVQADASAISGSEVAADSVEANIANLDAAVSSRLASAGYTAPDNAGIDALETNVTAIKAKTDQLAFISGDVVATLNGEVVTASVDEEAIADEVVAALSGVDIQIVQPIDPETLTLTIQQGDSYNTTLGNALEWSGSGWPDLTGGGVTMSFTVRRRGSTAVALTVTPTAVDANTLRVQLTDEQTSTLEANQQHSYYIYEIKYMISGHVLTLAEGKLFVRDLV